MESNETDALRVQAARQSLATMASYVQRWREHIDGVLNDPEHRDEHLQRALRAAHNVRTLHQHATGDTAALAGIDLETVARSDFAR